MVEIVLVKLSSCSKGSDDHIVWSQALYNTDVCVSQRTDDSSHDFHAHEDLT